MSAYAGKPLPTWQVLDRETGELVDTVEPGSEMDLALMAGFDHWLLRSEVAFNVLTREHIYRPGNTRNLLAQMTRDATSAGAAGQGFEATR